jgi:hypothetical protein
LAEQAAEKAESYSFQGYSYWAALTAPLAKVRVEERGRVFCSQLVVQAYEEAGVYLLPGIKASKTTPNALLKSPFLKDVTSEVTVLEKQHQYVPLDQIDWGVGRTLHNEEVRIIRRVIRRIRAKFKEMGLVPPLRLEEAILELLKQPDSQRQELDKHLYSVLREEGYFNLVSRYYEKFPNTEYVDELVSLGIRTGELTTNDGIRLLTLYRRVLVGSEQDIRHRRFQADVFRVIYERTQLTSLRMLWFLYEDQYELRRKTDKAIRTAIELLETKTVTLD